MTAAVSKISTPGVVEPYGLDPAFERAVVVLACGRPGFYGRIAHEVDPSLLGSPTASLALQAARAIAAETGSGPRSGALVLQRLRRWMQEGTITIDQLHAVSDLFDQVEDNDYFGVDESSAVNELTPILSERIRRAAIREGISEVGKRGDLSKVVVAEERAARLGQVDVSVGTTLLDDVEEPEVPVMMTGIEGLDMRIGGGTRRGSLACLLGGTGDGKSVGLCHVAAANVVDGQFVAYATLELPESEVKARIRAAITGIPVLALRDNAQARAEASSRLARYAALGPCYVNSFTAHATTPEDVFAWVKNCEALAQRKLDLLIVDYADKLTATLKKGEKDSGEYTSQRKVYEAIRIYAEDRQIWSWTASQAGRVTKERRGKKYLDTNDAADSIHKSRVVDYMVTLNKSGSNGEEVQSDTPATMTLWMAKNRYGEDRFAVGPEPTDFSLGRLVAVSRTTKDGALVGRMKK